MKKLLIVDDSLFIRVYLKDMIYRQIKNNNLKPVEIYEANGKNAAIETLKDINPDIMIVDIVMQESNQEGLELLDCIKGGYDMRKIIVISAVKQPKVLSRCKTLGVEHYFQKPFSHPNVADVMNKIITTH